MLLNTSFLTVHALYYQHKYNTLNYYLPVVKIHSIIDIPDHNYNDTMLMHRICRSVVMKGLICIRGSVITTVH